MTYQLRERVAAFGAAGLSDEELLSVLIGSGSRTSSLGQIAAAIAAQYPQLSQLATAAPQQLARIKGIGAAKASVLCAAVELGMRVQRRQSLRFGSYGSVKAVGTALKTRLSGLDQEVMLAIFLDGHQQVIAENEVAKGGFASAVVDVKVVLKKALLYSATGLILAHNHPGGMLVPSKADLGFTKRMQAACSLVDVMLLDHLIISGNGYYSFLEAGKL